MEIVKGILVLLGIIIVIAIGYLVSTGIAWVIIAVTGWKISVWKLGFVIFVLHYIFSR